MATPPNDISLKRRLRAWIIVTLGTIMFRLWFATCRVRLVGEDIYRHYTEARLPAVVATWHRGAVFIVWQFRRVRPMIMFSRSNDGELIARFAEKLGVIPVRGSSSRGGGQALRTMLKFLNGDGSRIAATVLDGPRGPRFEAKKGLLFLSRISGAPLVPVVVSAWPALTLKKSWDRTLIPLPFSRVTVIIGEPVPVPPDTDSAGLDVIRLKVENTLKEMMRAADADTGYIREWPNIYDPADTTPKQA
ncbi:MAG: lysophospholipid acyltransferase family protein [Pseudomonadota bacterium]